MRKPPYKHPVRGHVRSGKYIDHYERGKGKKPGEAQNVKPKLAAGSMYNVVFSFTDGSTESYNGRGTATAALRQAMTRIQRAMVPKRATLTLVR